MGGRYEVKVWDAGTGRNDTAYMGSSLLAAAWTFWRKRNEGTGCVSFYYRRK